jgi:hypothetical protein
MVPRSSLYLGDNVPKNANKPLSRRFCCGKKGGRKLSKQEKRGAEPGGSGGVIRGREFFDVEDAGDAPNESESATWSCNAPADTFAASATF